MLMNGSQFTYNPESDLFESEGGSVLERAPSRIFSYDE